MCTKDPFGYDLPIYTFETLCRQDNSIKLNDRTYKYFFNASAAEKIKDNEEVKNLLFYIKDHVAQSAFTKRIENRVEASSDDQKWRKGLMTFEMLIEEKKKKPSPKELKKVLTIKVWKLLKNCLLTTFLQKLW